MMVRHGHGLKKHDTSTTRHEGDRATGQLGTIVGPGLSRILGAVARHRHNTILG
jgi:hypothetical protein